MRNKYRTNSKRERKRKVRTMDGRQNKDDKVQSKIQRNYDGRQVKIPIRKRKKRRTKNNSKMGVRK